MKLRNVLIVLSKIVEQSKKYYHDLFGLEMLLDAIGWKYDSFRGARASGRGMLERFFAGGCSANEIIRAQALF